MDDSSLSPDRHMDVAHSRLASAVRCLPMGGLASLQDTEMNCFFAFNGFVMMGLRLEWAHTHAPTHTVTAGRTRLTQSLLRSLTRSIYLPRLLPLSLPSSPPLPRAIPFSPMLQKHTFNPIPPPLGPRNAHESMNIDLFMHAPCLCSNHTTFWLT